MKCLCFRQLEPTNRTAISIPPAYVQVRLARVQNTQERNVRKPIEHGKVRCFHKPTLNFGAQRDKAPFAYIPAEMGPEDRRSQLVVVA
eukprot:4359399-Amphidinium_carterae.1